jgi:hypothetical protein
MLMRIITMLLLGIGIVLAILAFQRQPSNLEVKGYLDSEQRIYYVGGIVEGTDNTFFAERAWHKSPTTREEIDYYVQASREAGQKLLAQGENDFYVGVTFRQYLSPEEFESFASSVGANVTYFTLRATFPKLDPKTRVTIWGSPSGDRIINPDSLSRQMDELRFQAREKKADQVAVARSGDPDAEWIDVLETEEFKAITVVDNDAVLNGVISFEALTDAKGYQQFLQDPRVFHVDVTANMVYDQLKDKGITWKAYVKTLNLGDFDPFWSMETLGLRKFQVK